MIQFQDFTDAQLTAFRRFQRTSYDVPAEVAAQIVPDVATSHRTVRITYEMAQRGCRAFGAM